MPYLLAMSGSIGSEGAKVVGDQTPLMKAIGLAFQATFDAVFGDGIPIASSDEAPFVPALGAVTAVRAIAIRSVDGASIVVKLTSAKGTDQEIPVSDLLVIQAKNVGDEYTAIKIVGTATVEYLLAGNLAP